MPNAQLLGILLAAMVAGVILFRLYQVLGRRTGNERPPQDPRFGKPADKSADAPSNVVPLPGRATAQVQTLSDPLAQALLDIKLADRTFESEHFVSGARAAYEMIVTAFAANDRKTLKPLLSGEVFHAFDGAIAGREQRHETVSYTFVGFKNA
ncbi:MAG TPA: Tim44/TimA family putative adaptor protein, partial [Rhizomicrobium sp.]|nr:Tim44/TimA family putative adaptor protein [Rhizomicrobium sp.]